MTSESSNDCWYYAQAKKKMGPVRLVELRRLLADGCLNPADMVLQEGASKWYPLAEVISAHQEIRQNENADSPARASPSASACGPIDLKCIKDSLLADGKIDRAECAFLIILRRETQPPDPQLDDLAFQAIERIVLQAGAVSAADTIWLKELLPSDGKVNEREKQFLKDLIASPGKHCHELIAWCNSLGIDAKNEKPNSAKKKRLRMMWKRLLSSAESERRWRRMAIGLFLLVAVSIAVGAYYLPKMREGLRDANATEQSRGLDFASPGTPIKGNLYLVAVGISKYKNSKYNLSVADADAKRLAETVQKQSRGLFEKVTPKVLTNDKATREGIIEELASLKVNQHDLVFVTLSGHGAHFDDNEDYHFLPYDYDNSRKASSGVYWEDFKRYLGNLPCQVVLVLDTCHSGTVTKQLHRKRSVGEQKAAMAKGMRGLQQPGGENSMVVIAACMGSGKAQEKNEWGHGALTLALLEGLSGQHLYKDKGKAATRLPEGHGDQQCIHLRDLDDYITRRVEELTAGDQSVVSNNTGNVALTRIFIASLK
jgi:hypothetical protein